MNRIQIVAIGFLFTIIASAQTSVDKNISNSAGYDAEPSLAINSTNSNNLVAAWMSLSGLRIGIRTRHSTDGGATWGTIQTIPHQFTSYQSADPSLAFSRTGVAYLCYIDYKNNSLDSGGVFICKSTNGGASWGSPLLVRDIRETPDLALDRPWIAIDKSGGARDGHVYVTSKPAPWSTGSFHLHLKKSTDAGATWSADIQVDDATFPAIQQSMGVVGVSRSGQVHIVYVSPNLVTGRLICATTTNGGSTFQRTLILSGNGSPDTNYQNGYSLAVNPFVDGNLVVTSIDNRNGDPDVILSYSTNSGTSWSSPRRINDDPLGNGVGQDMVWSDFSPNGTFGLAWRDRRLNGPTATVPFDIYTTISSDGGATTRANKKISSASSAFSSLTRGNDFLGIVLDNQNLYADWGDWRNSNWEIYFNTEPLSSYTSVKELGGVPLEYALDQNFPNPFNPTTTVNFRLPVESRVVLRVHSLIGTVIVTLVDGRLDAGNYSINFDGNNLASGVYYCTLATEGFIQTRTMVLIK